MNHVNKIKTKLTDGLAFNFTRLIDGIVDGDSMPAVCPCPCDC